MTGYSYDDVSRLTGLTHDLAGTASDLTLGFGYNPAGQIAGNTRSNDAFSFTGHANINRADTVNGLNQVTATGATSVGYDARGNIQTIGSNYYEYSIENRLAWVWDPDPTALAYDPLGRIHQTAYPTNTRYAYAGAQLISELDTANALQRRYVFGPGIDEPLVWYEGSGTSDRRWLHADERGSVIAVSDGNGDLVGTRNRYDEYGVPQGSLTGRFGYTGQAWLPDIGLYDYRNRIYHPGLGRFMQTDPIGYGGGMNLYAYVANDPVNLTDPLGLQDECHSSNCATVTGPFKGGLGLGGIGGNGSLGPAGQRMVSSSAPVEEIVVTGWRGMAEDIVVTAIKLPKRPAIVQLVSDQYFGNSFCQNPTVGALNRWNPYGRINSGKRGNSSTALTDVGVIASLNGITPMSAFFTDEELVRLAFRSPFPVALGSGWYGWTNPVSGYTSISNRGLTLRTNRITGDTRVDIPAGFQLPTGGWLAQAETCHYNP